MASVMIVGGTEETRLLLRGLLRLYRHRVVGEGPTFAALSSAPDPQTSPTVALVDIDLDDADAVHSIAKARQSYPGIRVLLLTPTRTPAVEARAKQAGIDALIRRPFAVHELMEALGAAGDTRQP
ncbi:MAG TPA: response regulator [Thermoplasmata archaeon]|nr:response regulator [Thermoplasmata archaeon]